MPAKANLAVDRRREAANGPCCWWRVLAALALLGSCHPARAAPQPEKPEIVVRVIEGTVEFSRVGSGGWDPSYTNQVLRSGDRLRTGERSRVLVRLSDKTDLRLGELSHFEVSKEPASRWKFTLLRGLFYFFHRDQPEVYGVETPTVSAVVRGTEFTVAVTDSGTTAVSVLEGEAELSNEFGQLLLKSGERGVCDAGQAPARTAVLATIKEIQWCLYYPGVLDPDELDLSQEEQQLLGASLTAYREGDLLSALRKYPAGRLPASRAEEVYLAALLLAVGQVDQAERRLDGVEAQNGRYLALARALRRLVAAIRYDRGGVRPGSSNVAPLATEALAESFWLQAQARFPEALRAAREAVAVSTNFAFGWARVAELEFSFGRVREARAALERSLALAPRNAQALALQGFLLSADARIEQAIAYFDKAIGVDGGLGNAWLGRGLCLIRQGEREAGRADLQVAAVLEPNRSFLRSYLGKAWSETGRDALAAKELRLAEKLDNNDPTPWLYSALLKQKQNRINEAIGDLERSVELNDNRQVYRSRFLLDQDRAVRSASLASIYRDAGMSDVSLREALRAVTDDYANYSGHLFLANSYEALRGSGRTLLRYETPALSEYLIENLLAPASGASLSPTVSQQEYSKFFERDGFGFSSSAEYLSRGGRGSKAPRNMARWAARPTRWT